MSAKFINGIPHVVSRQFELAVGMGLVPGFETIDKYGFNPVITPTSDPEDIWEEGGVYTFSADGVSDIDTMSSSSTADVGNLIRVRGILSSDESVTGEAFGYSVLNGQAKVLIYDNEDLTGDPITFWRAHRLENESPAGGDLVGVCYCYVDTVAPIGIPTDKTKIRSEIINGNNQSQMMIYTVPRGSVGFLYRGEVGIALDTPPVAVEFATGQYRSRRFGKLFKTKKSVNAVTSGASNYADVRSFMDPIPALSDLKITIEEVSADMGAWGSADILLVDENLMKSSYLAAIGQPGY